MYCSIIPSLRKNWNVLVLTYLMKNEFGIEEKSLRDLQLAVARAVLQLFGEKCREKFPGLEKQSLAPSCPYITEYTSIDPPKFELRICQKCLKHERRKLGDVPYHLTSTFLHPSDVHRHHILGLSNLYIFLCSHLTSFSQHGSDLGRRCRRRENQLLKICENDRSEGQTIREVGICWCWLFAGRLKIASSVEPAWGV
jgi:hypothetical protein